MTNRRVVVTGMGLITGLGERVDTFWNNIVAGVSGVRKISLFDTKGFDVEIGGECKDFDAGKYFDRKAARRMDRFSQFAVAAAREAVETSGLDLKNYSGDPGRLGVILGSGIGGLMEFEQQFLRLIEKGPSKVSAFTIPNLMVNAASGNIAIEHNMKGITTAVCTACASACHAMRDAYSAIVDNHSDVMISGGSEAALTPLGLSAFAAIKALSCRNDNPEAASRPFDKDRDGFILSEGSGILVFEELEHAKKRGANILVEVLGFGASTDAGHIAQPAENGSGAAEAMKTCLHSAGVNLEEIDYINAHGTSTGLGDIAEAMAIKTAFGDHAKKLAVSSTKSATGHLLGASGGVETIATIMAMRNSIAPPTLNLENPDEGCDLDFVPKVAREMPIRKAMSNSFGFGGHNATILLSQYE